MKRLIILLMLLVPVSLIAKDVGWTIDKNTKTEMTINMDAQHNYTAPYIISVKAELLNVSMVSVKAPSYTRDVLLFDRFEKSPNILYFKPPLLNASMKYNRTYYTITSRSGPELYHKRI